MSTYIEGRLLNRSPEKLVVQTTEGTYWIALSRPPNWSRKCKATSRFACKRKAVSFWIDVNQIRRFRPVARG